MLCLSPYHWPEENSAKFRKKRRNSAETGKFRGSAQSSAFRGKLWSLAISASLELGFAIAQFCFLVLSARSRRSAAVW